MEKDPLDKINSLGLALFIAHSVLMLVMLIGEGRDLNIVLAFLLVWLDAPTLWILQFMGLRSGDTFGLLIGGGMQWYVVGAAIHWIVAMIWKENAGHTRDSVRNDSI